MAGKKAGVKLAVRREPGPRAIPAERLRNRRDHADLTAVRVPEAARHFARIVRPERLQRRGAAEPRDDLRGRHHLLQSPAVRVAHIHVFDEAQDETASSETLRQRLDFVVIHAAFYHHVDLDRREARRLRRLDPPQHPMHGKVHVVHRAKGRVVQRVHTHREPPQPRRA